MKRKSDKIWKNLFGKRLATARADLGMTQVEVGLVLNRDSMTISRWERGVVVPGRLVRVGALTILARAFGDLRREDD